MLTHMDAIKSGIAEENEGHYSASLEMLGSVIKEVTDTDIIAITYNWMGIALRGLGDYDEAMENYDASIGVNPHSHVKGWAHVNKADIYRVGKREHGTAHQMLDLAAEHHGEGSIVNCLEPDQRGLVFVSEKEYDRAIESYLRARGEAEKLLDGVSSPYPEILPQPLKKLEQILQHLGVAYHRVGRDTEAIDLQGDGLRIAEQLGDIIGLTNCMALMSEIAEYSGDIGHALEILSPIKAKIEGTDFRRGDYCIALHLASLYLFKGNKSEFEKYMGQFFEGVENGQIRMDDLSNLKPRIETIFEAEPGIKVSDYVKEKIDSV